MQIAKNSIFLRLNLQNGPHHDIQWEILPQFHIWDDMFEVKFPSHLKTDLNLNSNQFWRENKKRKRKRKRKSKRKGEAQNLGLVLAMEGPLQDSQWARPTAHSGSLTDMRCPPVDLHIKEKKGGAKCPQWESNPRPRGSRCGSVATSLVQCFSTYNTA